MNPYGYMAMPMQQAPMPKPRQGQGQYPQGPGPGTSPALPAVEESYIENIFRLNRGKMVTVYTTFENNKEWNAKIFRGRIEAAGRDHLILSEPSGRRYLIPLLYLDYATFDGEIAYEYPYNG
ncbi:spore coat protein GerQ [Domibacillus mangrovi]|uniref:Spore coat protein GerQ n=1 Tax=Domibacillus mangrovi TaxID=1714354 RepID=A0A1Q5P620_9BACI|nr:spore coat protein GerQ [Domibacillus mangrovi]